MTYRPVHFHRHQFLKDDPMRVDIFHHLSPDSEVLARLDLILDKLDLVTGNTEKIMADVTDLKPALDAIDAKVSVVKTDVDTLLAKLAAIPTVGLTPAQQAAIDDAVAHANIIAASLGAIDTTVNPAPPVA
jgi:hypothetical protein